MTKHSDIVEHFTNALSQYKYNMSYSNMDNKTALNIISSTISIIINDLQNGGDWDEYNYSEVASMLERAKEKLDNLIKSRD